MRSKNTEISFFYLPKSVFSEADNQDLYIIGNSRSQHSLSEQAIESDCIGLQDEEENGGEIRGSINCSVSTFSDISEGQHKFKVQIEDENCA